MRLRSIPLAPTMSRDTRADATLLQCSRGIDTRFAKAAHNFQDWCGPVQEARVECASSSNTPSSHLEQGHGDNADSFCSAREV